MDWFLYTGEIRRGTDLEFFEFVAGNKSSDEVCLVLCTPGGAPDAAYKMGRYLQTRYDSFKLLVPGFCKSAGTLLAIGSDEIIFSPYGELGPLDIQMAKADNLVGLESGLNTSEAFLTLEKRARDTFHDLVIEIIRNSGGIISFQTASHSASEIVSSLFGPIFGRIDPEEVGSRARAMRIGEDYGARLNQKYENLKQDALTILSQSYTSHGFVIDMEEAKTLFKQVREASDAEKALIDALGMCCRIPEQTPKFTNISELVEDDATKEPKEPSDGKPQEKSEQSEERKRPARKQSVNGENPANTGQA